MNHKKNIFVLSTVLLTSCAGTLITKENAIQECLFLNVPCPNIINSHEFPVKIVGIEVADFCSGNSNGCVTNNTIYLRENDWKVLGHERCHNYCSNANKQYKVHFKKKRGFTSILADAKAL